MFALLLSRLKTNMSSFRKWPPKALNTARVETTELAMYAIWEHPPNGGIVCDASRQCEANPLCGQHCLLSLLVALSPDPAFWRPYQTDFARAPHRHTGFVNGHVQSAFVRRALSLHEL